MLMKLVMTISVASCAGSAQAATYFVLPSPGSMTPATVIVDEGGRNGPLFICSTFSDIGAGTCQLHRKRSRY